MSVFRAYEFKSLLDGASQAWVFAAGDGAGGDDDDDGANMSSACVILASPFSNNRFVIFAQMSQSRPGQ